MKKQLLFSMIFVAFSGIQIATIQAAQITFDTSLLEAIEDNDIDEAKKLIAKGTDVNKADHEGVTPLMEAAERGLTDMANLLIAEGANINKQDNIGNTALMLAIYQGLPSMVELLISNGADATTIRNTDGKTALMEAEARMARGSGFRSIAEFIRNNVPPQEEVTSIEKFSKNY